MADYYDGTKLLSLRDVNGNKPEIYICTSNRTAGKTTYFNRLAVNSYKKRKEKFAVLYRFSYELDDCASKFFKNIGGLFFRNDVFTSVKKARGTYHEFFLNGESCGYALAINSADQIKKMSVFFSDTTKILFDEFQSESNTYAENEIIKFRSIHTSLARGEGKQTKYLPVYMIGNPVSILNPYYAALGISSKINDRVKFLRGNGFVLEQSFNESACNAMLESGFNKAFTNDEYLNYSAKGNYMYDDSKFIEKPSGFGEYVCTLKFNGTLYALREFAECGFIYCDDRADTTFPKKIVVTAEDHDINYIMLKKNSLYISYLRNLFEKGAFRFKNLQCKEAVLAALSY